MSCIFFFPWQEGLSCRHIDSQCTSSCVVSFLSAILPKSDTVSFLHLLTVICKELLPLCNSSAQVNSNVMRIIITIFSTCKYVIVLKPESDILPVFCIGEFYYCFSWDLIASRGTMICIPESLLVLHFELCCSTAHPYDIIGSVRQ